MDTTDELLTKILEELEHICVALNPEASSPSEDIVTDDA